MKFELDINMDNAAFDGDNWREELKEILSDVGESVSQLNRTGDNRMFVYDSNDNRIGTVKFTGEGCSLVEF